LRQAIRLLKDKQLLAVFPAGEVSHLRLGDAGISDPPWDTTVARIARMTNASVLPIYFDGANSAIFQMLGLVHPRLRPAMLVRELFAKRGHRIDMRLGSILPAK